MVENNVTTTTDTISPVNIDTPLFQQYYLKAPCHCCGSDEHALLICKQVGDSQILEYSCPNINTLTELTDMTVSESLIISHTACPIKIAETCNYNMLNILKAIVAYRTHGTGKWLTDAEYSEFKLSAFRELDIHYQEINNLKTHKELFEAPCRICGKTDHPMLYPALTERGSVRFHYSCPVAEHDNWKEACEKEDNLAKYNICPYKFAKECNYNYTSVHEALDQVRICKRSKYLDTHTIRMFRLKVLQICSQNQPDITEPTIKIITEVGIVTASFILAILIGTTMTQRGPQL